MKIAGVEKNSFIDYPGKISFVIFTQGCNMNCFFCHNHDLINYNSKGILYDEMKILRLLNKRRNFIDAVVITGGEPTMQPDLIEFSKKIKSLGYLLKIDTNGSNPDVIRQLVDEHIVDYIAMDLKATYEKYEEVCGVKGLEQKIEDTARYIMNCGIDYEFRTTFIPQLTTEDIFTIVNSVKGAKRYALQQYRKPDTDVNDRLVDMRVYTKPHSETYIKETAESIEELVDYCTVRGLIR